MTIDPPPFIPSKKIPAQPLIDPSQFTGKFHAEKKHYDGNKSDLQKCELPRSESRSRLGANYWKPSANYVEFNNKKLRCYLGSNRVLKEISGKDVNKSQIIGMAGIDTSRKSEPIQRRLKIAPPQAKEIINYVNAPNFRERKIAEKINQIDISNRSKTPSAIRTQEVQHAEYRINMLNSRASKIVFS